MKKLFWGVSFLAASCFGATAFAIPSLQLDVIGGTYDSSAKTIMAGSTSFTLRAYLIEDQDNLYSDQYYYYYISGMVVPQRGPVGGNWGSFGFGVVTSSISDGMVYGVPPIDLATGLPSGDLQTQSIFPTYFSQYGVTFSEGNQITPYDTEARAISGGVIPTAGSGMYYAEFVVDVGKLSPG